MADVEINLEITNPQELVGLGIRAYAIGDFSNAAAAFGRATQLMAEKHGDEHDSLGEIYIQYAKSLLEVSREEAEPLGDAIPHGDEDTSSEDDTEEGGSSNGTTEKEESAKDETDEPKKEDPPKKEEEIKEETAQNGEDTKTEEPANGESSSKQEDPEDPQEDPQENCTDLQLAWEVLEVAKKIFTNRGDSGKEHLAETLILLGEVAMESENFQDGINDVKAGIELQKELFEPHSRKLAESYYKLGIAHSTVSNIEEAVECFKNSIETLKKRIEFLKESKIEKTDRKKNKKDEIEEMENLIPEIEEKIADTKSIKEEMATQLLQEMAGAAESKLKTPTKEEAPSSSKANDISHLVKRKRKADEEQAEPESQPAKRPTP